MFTYARRIYPCLVRLMISTRVRDDSLVVSTADPWHTDACEVYVDGAHSGKKFIRSGPEISAADLPALQYVLCPPGGSYGEAIQSADPSANPNIAGGDIAKTRTKGAVTREGDVTIYEWAIEAFDHYPDAPTKLAPEKTIGFDVVAADKDTETDTPAWICWAPFGSLKHFNADLLGDLILVESYADLGTLAGIATKEKKPYSGLVIEAYRGDDEPAGSVQTDAEGRYHLTLQPGKYTLRVRRGQGVEPSEAAGLTVRAGQETHADFSVTPIKLPKVLKRCAAVYKSLRGYRDTTTVEIHMVRLGMDNRMTMPVFFAFERSNRLRLESKAMPMGETALVSDGRMLTTYQGRSKQYMQKEAPEKLTSADLGARWRDRLGTCSSRRS